MSYWLLYAFLQSGLQCATMEYRVINRTHIPTHVSRKKSPTKSDGDTQRHSHSHFALTLAFFLLRAVEDAIAGGVAQMPQS